MAGDKHLFWECCHQQDVSINTLHTQGQGATHADGSNLSSDCWTCSGSAVLIQTLRSLFMIQEIQQTVSSDLRVELHEYIKQYHTDSVQSLLKHVHKLTN